MQGLSLMFKYSRVDVERACGLTRMEKVVLNTSLCTGFWLQDVETAVIFKFQFHFLASITISRRLLQFKVNNALR